MEGDAMVHVTKRAVSCAGITENEKRRGSLPEALPEIGAGGFLAHRVEPVVAEYPPYLIYLRTAGIARPQPLRFFHAAKDFLAHDQTLQSLSFTSLVVLLVRHVFLPVPPGMNTMGFQVDT
jgi:hypothetical protein